MSISTALENLKNAIINKIDSIDRYQSLWTCLPEGTYTDPFGEFTVTAPSTTAVLKAEANNRTIKSVSYQAVDKAGVSYINMAINGVDSISVPYVSIGGTPYRQDLVFFSPKCLVYPKRLTSVGELILLNTALTLYRGLYLPQITTNPMSSGWISVIAENSNGVIVSSLTIPFSAHTVVVKCPPETEMRYIYLQMLPMTAEVMVDLFNNLKDVSGLSDTYNIKVGSTNLAKLTTEQKNIAINKGWILS